MREKSLFKTFIGFAIGPLGAAAINFLTIPIITWLISPEEFGKTSIFLLMQTLANAIIFLGMDQSYVREYNDAIDKKKLLFNCIVLPFIFSIVIAGVLILFSKDITGMLLKGQSHLVLVLFAISLPFITLERFYLLSIRMEEKGLIYSIFNIIVKLFIMVFTVVFLLYWSRNYLSVIIGSVAGQVISDILLIFYCKGRIRWALSIDKDLLKQMFRFGLPFIPTAFIMWFLNSTDRIVLERFSSYDQLGVYFAALKVIGVLTIFQTIFATFWLPIAYKWKKENVDTQKFSQISHYIGFLMSMVFIFILLMKQVFIYILSDKYGDVVFIIPFLLFYPIMYTLAETTGLGISFSRKTHYNIWISVCLCCMNLLLNLILVPYINALGASIALGVTYILYFWIKTIVSRRLWYNFNLMYYVKLTIILLLTAVGNVLLEKWIIYFNVLLMCVVILYHKNIICEFYASVKNKKGVKATF
ncbi:oligosaccharide flippase family protein [Priestia aryabhattai]|uniref:lipopolysaccharide biosynthesis protein n=1 Tax=Priestia aryabhattai TaxID=412384 RepID=UPI001C0B92E0|nr:oligosaccharide flippase family protein [Priestia aryabhattai]MBU3570700.1 oligosaccharide flippase family protein [Priestia aryabhattai]